MNPIEIVPIVEGQGEVSAVPELLRRFAQDSEVYNLKVNPPIRVRSSSFLKSDKEFNRHIQLAANKAGQNPGLVLILLDCQDDCPAKLGPMLLEKAQAVRSDVEYLCVLAHREYETWFIAAAESLAGCKGLKADLQPLPHPESKRDAKGWLTEHMPKNLSYDPIQHQTALTAQFSFDQAEAVPSFSRFRRKIREFFRRGRGE